MAWAECVCGECGAPGGDCENTCNAATGDDAAACTACETTAGMAACSMQFDACANDAP